MAAEQRGRNEPEMGGPGRPGASAWPQAVVTVSQCVWLNVESPGSQVTI